MLMRPMNEPDRFLVRSKYRFVCHNSRMDLLKLRDTVAPAPDENSALVPWLKLQSIQDFRAFFGWLFLIKSAGSAIIAVLGLRFFLRQHFALPTYSLLLASIFGVAWWDIWKQRPSAKWWGIAASLLLILIFFRQFIYGARPVWYLQGTSLLVALVGIGGLVVFLWPDKSPNR